MKGPYRPLLGLVVLSGNPEILIKFKLLKMYSFFFNKNNTRSFNVIKQNFEFEKKKSNLKFKILAEHMFFKCLDSSHWDFLFVSAFLYYCELVCEYFKQVAKTRLEIIWWMFTQKSVKFQKMFIKHEILHTLQNVSKKYFLECLL